MIVPALVVSSVFAGGFVERSFPVFRFSPDGAYLAVAAVDEEDNVYSGGKVLIWELSHGEVVLAHDQHVSRIQFHPSQPLLRVTHPYDSHDTPIEDFTYELGTGQRSAVGAYPFAGWTDAPGEVYAYTDHLDIDGDGRRDHAVRRVSMFDAGGALAVQRVQPIDYGPFEPHLTVDHSWAQSVLYQPRWLEQSAATGELWATTQQGLFRMGPSLDAAQRVSAPAEVSVTMGVDGRLIVVDWRVVVDTVVGTKRKLSKKLLLSDTVLPGSESVLVLSAEKDRFLVVSSAGELKREIHLPWPLAGDCFAGTINGYDNPAPCTWHEPTERLAVHTPEGIRLIDTATGSDVALLDTGIDVRAVWAEQRRLREIEEEAEHQRAVQHREETRIAVEARLQAEHDHANRPVRQLHLRANMGLMEATGSCASVYVDVPMEMSDAEAVQEVRSRLLGAGIRVLSFEEIPPGGESQCPESFSSMDLR